MTWSALTAQMYVLQLAVTITPAATQRSAMRLLFFKGARISLIPTDRMASKREQTNTRTILYRMIVPELIGTSDFQYPGSTPHSIMHPTAAASPLRCSRSIALRHLLSVQSCLAGSITTAPYHIGCVPGMQSKHKKQLRGMPEAVSWNSSYRSLSDPRQKEDQYAEA